MVDGNTHYLHLQTVRTTRQDRLSYSLGSYLLFLFVFWLPQPIICFHPTLDSASSSQTSTHFISSFITSTFSPHLLRFPPSLLLASSNLNVLQPIYYPYPMLSCVLCRPELWKHLHLVEASFNNLTWQWTVQKKVNPPINSFDCFSFSENVSLNRTQFCIGFLWCHQGHPYLFSLRLEINKPSQVILLPTNVAFWLPRLCLLPNTCKGKQTFPFRSANRGLNMQHFRDP